MIPKVGRRSGCHGNGGGDNETIIKRITGSAFQRMLATSTTDVKFERARYRP